MSFLRNASKACMRVVFRLLVDRSLQPRPTEGNLHILIPRWDAKLGDSIVSSFFFREARKLNARVTVLTVVELAQMHALDFGVDQVVITNANPGLLELRRLAQQIGKVDVVVHLVGRIQPAEILFLRLLRPARVYSLDDRLRCVNRKFGETTAGLDMAERYRRVLLDLGACMVDRKYIIPLPDTMPNATSAPRILFNPYASRPDKSLAFDRSVSLLHAIADAYPAWSVGILCSPATREDALCMEVAAARRNVRVVHGLASPKDAAGYIRCAQVVVSVDTAIVHMAVGLETKLVAIYPAMAGQANPWLPPPSPLTRVVYSQQHTGQIRRTGKKDMNAFSIETLLDNLHELLATTPETEQLHSLRARIVPGLGVAQGTLARQLPLISKDFPEVADCHPGTINLELECPLEVTQPDHRTAPLAWTPSGRTTEVFDLVRIELEFGPLPTRVPAWLYVAHASPHRGTPTVHEVIAQQLNLSEVRECQIHLRASAVTLTLPDQLTAPISRSLSPSQ
ncbi:glycosyltransferase family 9 protein [Stutzerimonas stutzeri]|uniref:glycosyltransferase family 9 protein n=1 Tax=Pseudomonadaceae TaxID=135621 RepID=UPI00066CA151|nr:glycosyltransferase family 9 protein [Stutzerimonas stutzeri]HBO8936952.1 glycosyltransferase family 9 protein [Pseudomonas aeruginosa]MDH0184080.1 glycosyltransferase family 9 protein [Stutzerimonas stutzeri]MDH1248581.1 glycosyltransferase family 9 protein [Stutzerimonas stutzeri]RAA01937.1 lipopolysaccharide heptosyltransferase family protein [Stutzerimonas stutzeri]TGY11547.1 lipopolysaccharide heptosyltransferase family protein [Stutzerimonas stutzeri]